MRLKKSSRIAAILLGLLTFIPVAAPAATSSAKNYKVSSLYTTLAFIATKWQVFKEEGIFHDFAGTLTYDPSNPEACAIDVTVQSNSLDTRSNGRDNVLRSDDFFDVAKYPTLSFHSTSVATAGSGVYNVTGDLTIHGITHRITIPAKLIGARMMQGIGDFAGFETTFTIDRRDYGVLGSRWSGNTLAIEPEVVIHLIIGGIH